MATTSTAPPLYTDLEAILSRFRRKRSKQIAFLRRYIDVLQKRVGHLQWSHSTLLGWEDVSKALAEDTLDRVRENRSLKREVAASQGLRTLLAAWVSAHASSPHTRTPGHDPWTTARLFNGAPDARKVGLEWILQQCYHNTSSALAHVSAALHNDDDAVRVAMTFDGTAMSLTVTSQWIEPYPMPHVADATWSASRSFLATCCSKQTNCSTLRTAVSSYVEYFHEDVGPPCQKIIANALYGRYDTPDRTVLISRSVLSDEAHPVPQDTWCTDSRQWIVLDRMHANATRVRVYDYSGHPIYPSGQLVPLTVLAKLKRFETTSDDAAKFPPPP
ncbi:hypothetical protein SDRG_04666 [Saprolegnia diclina VS20]|uniref:Uncharacterized protein n=1 Tax=Saprolegnia diclina (strain VS20) TaxID=1156394 RepID=T0QJL9_SAPDV|nr:hypothetical protein SDRG_04666 [Saprolegnia diclina VS20]EQC38239.1 hypothetical protein SDRG_04666 [Saprolegnia diclina VS20]|eukprot:XP_008608566.1 hypothetical protein SDRG_04666 [Saprolegnia diclina VS20]